MSALIIFFHVLACLVLILTVLLQAGSEAGLSGSFGGSSDTLLGAKSSSFLTKFTTSMAIVFMVTSLVLAVVASKRNRSVVMSSKTIEPAVVEDKAVVEEETSKPEVKEAVEEKTETAKQEVKAEVVENKTDVVAAVETTIEQKEIPVEKQETKELIKE
jgi:preprotein translocase subunit SecG